jgi:dsRNA-specific ribonuclease
MTANELIAALSALSAAQRHMPVISYDRLDSLGDVVGIEQVTLEMEFEGAEDRERPALSLRVEEFTEPQWIAFTTKRPR